MKCSRCEEEIAEGEQYDYFGQTLCEDCYIGAIEPPRTCDVTAVFSAKKSRDMAGQTGTEGLSQLQKEIYDFIQEKGQVTKDDICNKFKLPAWEYDKQFAVLRHCELLKGKKEGNLVYIVPFND